MSRPLLFIPGPVNVAEPVLAAMARPMINHRGPEASSLLRSLEERLRPVFGTAGDVVILGSSGTGGLEAAVASCFSRGDKVLGVPVGVFGKRIASIARTWGLDVETLEVPYGHGADPRALADRLRADAKGEIKGIMLTHNETSTGVQNRMAELSAAIGDHPATVIVDSVSGLAASEFAMDRWRFDVVVTASQKALAVPPGIAMVAVSPRTWDRIARASSPRFYLDLQKAHEFSRNAETPWTPPLSILFALDVALDRYAAEGPENVWARHARYAAAIRSFADAVGIAVFSQPDAHSVTVVALAVPSGIDGSAVSRDLRERGIVIGGGQADLKGKIFRIGTMGDLSPDDVIAGLAAFETALSRAGYSAADGRGIAIARRALSPIHA